MTTAASLLPAIYLRTGDGIQTGPAAREAAVEAFGAYLDGTKFGVDQIRFINLIVNELTANGLRRHGPRRCRRSGRASRTVNKQL
jgi:hypothetical protein